MLAYKYYCICEEKVLFPCKIKVLAAGVGTRAGFRYRDLQQIPISHYCRLVPAFRRICNSSTLSTHFQYRKGKRHAAIQSCCFFLAVSQKPSWHCGIAIRKVFAHLGIFLRVTLEITPGSFWTFWKVFG